MAEEFANMCGAKLVEVPTDEQSSIVLDKNERYVLCLDGSADDNLGMVHVNYGRPVYRTN